MGWLWWAIPLAFTAFLKTLNRFLRGHSKQVIDTACGLVICVLVVVALLVSGWQIAVAALVGVVALGYLLRPVAWSLARRLIVYPDDGLDAYSRRQLDRTTSAGSSDDWRLADQKKAAEARQKTKAVAAAMKRPAIREVLRHHGASERDLSAFYGRTEVSILPPKARMKVVRNPGLVDFFLENSEPGEGYGGSYVRNLASQEVHARLQLWARYNPGGKEPRP